MRFSTEFAANTLLHIPNAQFAHCRFVARNTNSGGKAKLEVTMRPNDVYPRFGSLLTNRLDLSTDKNFSVLIDHRE